MGKGGCRHGVKRCDGCWRNAQKHRVAHKGVDKSTLSFVISGGMETNGGGDGDGDGAAQASQTLAFWQKRCRTIRQRALRKLDAVHAARIDHTCRDTARCKPCASFAAKVAALEEACAVQDDCSYDTSTRLERLVYDMTV